MDSSVMFSSIMPGLPGISIFCAAGGVGSCAQRVMAPTKETRRTGIVLPTFMEDSFVFAVFHPGKLTAKPRPAELRGSATHGRPHQQEKCCNCRATASTGVPPVLAGAAGAVGRRSLHQFCTEG